ncbi:MAG: peptidylprolyl isomerase [Chloroflexi bacterium]|nr:MAG: peptidylprolyl isomerase [Chloroflexota bacterium]
MPKQYAQYPEMVIDVTKTYQAIIKTDKGDIHIDLFAADAPKTVNNFVFLARDKFYDGLTFHRVIDGFVSQGGCPRGDGRGGPGYRFEDETANNPHRHETGSLSMANAGPNTNGSQFFICHAPQPHLDGRHTVFGKVTQGMEVVTALKNGDVMREVVIIER